MSMVIRQNLMAESALRNLTQTYAGMDKSIQRLSSGLRIVGSDDDAAGLAVREGMRAEVTSLGQGIRNANDAVSMLQTFDGGAQVIDEKLIRMKELAMQSATGTYSDEQRQIMNDEFEAMRDEIERIAQHTAFNEIKGLDGSGEGGGGEVTPDHEVDAQVTEHGDIPTGEGEHTLIATETFTVTVHEDDDVEVSAGEVFTVTVDESENVTGVTTVDTADDEDIVQIGEDLYQWNAGEGELESYEAPEGNGGQITIHFGSGNDQAEDYYTIDIQNFTSSGLGLDELDISSQQGAQESLGAIDSAIETKVTGRAHFGAVMNRLDNTVSAISIQRENLMAAESQVSDADVAEEMSAFTRQQVMAQAGTAMLAQANMVPQMALQLLG